MTAAVKIGPVRTKPRGGAGGCAAFTLVEVLAVVAIIAILLGLVVGVSSWAVKSARQRHTGSMLSLLDTAAEQFKKETAGSLGRIPMYLERYGGYPPDELAPFVNASRGGGIPNPAAPQNPGPVINPVATADVVPQDPDTNVPGADMRAFVLAVRLFSNEANVFLERIDIRFKRTADPSVHRWDRGGDTSVDATDEPLDYFVDSWETPIVYFNTREASPSAGSRSEMSSAILRFSGGRPVFCSYGPDGREQLSADFGNVTLLADWRDGTKAITNRFNSDNVYSIEGLADRLQRGP
jgi:prepilin-type N-terminal cleavage/methylation domain-containing protein